MIFIYFKGLMTKSAFLIKKQYLHRKLLCPFKGTCALQLPKKGFSMFYNPISIHLWKFLSYFYPHFSFIDMCLFLALSELLENQSQQSWVCFPAQDPVHIFSDLPNRASGSSLSSQAVNSAFLHFNSALRRKNGKVNYVNYVADREVCCFWATAKNCFCSVLFDLPCNKAHETKLNTCDAYLFLPFLKAWASLIWELLHIPIYSVSPQVN